MPCNCCAVDIIDKNLTFTEFNSTVYNLQCKFQEYVASITNNWKLGIFCADDSKNIIIAQNLLNLLLCYGVETSISLEGVLPYPECYQDWLDNSGTDLTDLIFLPPGSQIGDYFYIQNGVNYWILKGVQGFYSGSAGAPFPTSLILQILQGGDPIVVYGFIGSNNYYVMEVLCQSSVEELTLIEESQKGIEITSSGLPQEDLILIANHLEKILVC
jgi:hypothetical protein